MLPQLFEQGLCRLLKLGRRFSNLLDYLLARQVLQTVMDVRALVEDLEQTFSAIQESLLDRCEALSLFI